MATVNLSVNVGENKTITFHSGGTYNPEDIVFDVSANITSVKPVHPLKAFPPMLVTLLGMVMLVKLLHLVKA